MAGGMLTKPKTLKALTIWQPWAGLIMVGAKPYELRSWRPPPPLIGKRIVIHASARKPRSAEAVSLLAALERGGRAASYCALKTCASGKAALRDVIDGNTILGAGLGTAVIGEPITRAEAAAEFGLSELIYSSRICWAWPLLDIEVWDEPLPMRGYQGLWSWPEPKDLGL